MRPRSRQMVSGILQQLSRVYAYVYDHESPPGGCSSIYAMAQRARSTKLGHEEPTSAILTPRHETTRCERVGGRVGSGRGGGHTRPGAASDSAPSPHGRMHMHWTTGSRPPAGVPVGERKSMSSLRMHLRIQAALLLQLTSHTTVTSHHSHLIFRP